MDIEKLIEDLLNSAIFSNQSAIRKQISEIFIFLNHFYKHTYNNPPQNANCGGWKEDV